MTYVPVASTIDELKSLATENRNGVPLADILRSLLLSVGSVAKGDKGDTGTTGATGATGPTGPASINLATLAASTTYANDAAAAIGGVAVGAVYRNGSVIQLRIA